MRLSPFATVLLLAGCAAAQPGLPESPTVTRRVTDIETSEGRFSVTQMIESNLRTSALSGAPEAAWGALPGVFEELGIPVTMVDTKTRLLGTTEHRVRRLGKARLSRYLDCGSGMAGQHADLYDVYLTVVTQLHPGEGGATQVRTQVEASAKDGAHSNNPVRCTSKGTLEKAIVAGLQAKLGGASS